MPRTDVQELSKFGTMVSHFKIEHKGEGAIAFISFLAQHYGDEFNGSAHAKEQHSHQDLPLHNLSNSVSPVLHAEFVKLEIVATEFLQTSGYRETSLVSLTAGSKLWQPPKRG